MKVQDILDVKGSDVMTIAPTETIGTLAERLRDARIGALVVSPDGIAVDGIISERDVAHGLAAHKGDLHKLPVSALMTRSVVTCKPEDSIADAVKVMTARHIRHLPVADGDKLVGVISIRDVMKHRLEAIEQKTKLLREHATATAHK